MQKMENYVTLSIEKVLELNGLIDFNNENLLVMYYAYITEPVSFLGEEKRREYALISLSTQNGLIYLGEIDVSREKNGFKPFSEDFSGFYERASNGVIDSISFPQLYIPKFKTLDEILKENTWLKVKSELIPEN